MCTDESKALPEQKIDLEAWLWRVLPFLPFVMPGAVVLGLAFPFIMPSTGAEPEIERTHEIRRRLRGRRMRSRERD
jgi:hypothetical protein